MRISLDPDEVELLVKLIQSAQLEHSKHLQRPIPPQETARLERELRMLEILRRRLAELHREEVLDESVEESFPASDPPARSVVREKRSER